MKISGIYDRLSRVKFVAKSYSLKFLFVAFLGIHIPLIGFIVYLLFGPQHLNPITVLLLILLLTLVATAGTLFLLNGLLVPLLRAKNALEGYLDNRALPQLPRNYKDEAGILMDKLQMSLVTLNDLIEEKEDMATLLSHDLKQPLATICTLAEALQQTTDHKQIAKFSNNIGQMAKDQIALLNDVLQILRFDNLAQAEDNFELIPLEPFLEDVLESAEAQASVKNIDFSIQTTYDGMVQMHPELFRQVLKNLLHNAIKFSHANTTVIIVVNQYMGNLAISITDQGVGFAPEKSERLFDRFTKEGKSGTAGEASTGIGLHITKRIVEMHSGTVRGFSKGKGYGATFTVVIPNDEANRFAAEEMHMEAAVFA